MRRISIRLVFALLALLAAACAPLLAGTGLYVDDDKGFSIEFPPEWTIKTDFMNAEVRADSPADAEGRSLSIGVAARAIPEGMGLDETFETAMDEAVAEFFGEEGAEEEGTAIVDGRRFRWFIISIIIGPIKVKTITYVTISSEWAFAISAGGPAEYFDEYRPVLEQIVRTFRLISSPGPSRPATEELRVYTAPEEPRPAAPPPPARPKERAVIPFNLRVEQEGRPIQPIDREIALKRAPFTLVLTLPGPSGVMVHISGHPHAYQAALEGRPLTEIPGFGRSHFVEGVNNPRHELYLCDEDYQYWFYASPSMNRFDRVVPADAGGIVCYRTVDRLILADKGQTIPVARYEGEAIHLVFLQADRPAPNAPPREYHREILKIVFTR